MLLKAHYVLIFTVIVFSFGYGGYRFFEWRRSPSPEDLPLLAILGVGGVATAAYFVHLLRERARSRG